MPRGRSVRRGGALYRAPADGGSDGVSDGGGECRYDPTMNKDLTPAPGRFVVDRVVCLAHGACIDIAPTLFAIHADGYSASVVRQPITDAELAAMRRVIDECPVSAILDTHDRPA